MGFMAKHMLQEKSNEPEDTAIETIENETGQKKDNQKDWTEHHGALRQLQITKYTRNWTLEWEERENGTETYLKKQYWKFFQTWSKL